jgi:hypothetical protein
MRSGLKLITPALVACAAAASIAAARPAAADKQPTPAPPTVTVTAAPSGPADNQSCTSSAASTKCWKPGDAEINATIPAPYPGPFGIYGPYWAG